MKPIVSIVTGTYNRLAYLKTMIASTRLSAGTGLLYEIIVVDGGSTDGTQAWCLSQPDVILIEQHKLLGAVAAFNAGASAANGYYTILANDDITFINESIIRAVAYMENHMDVGIGCFYQDRNDRDYHVEEMPVVKDGKQASYWYGQVCIVRTWLGNKVGWWGDYLKTYGGDNELSCNVLELGYDIQPIDCCMIHDAHAEVNDALRKANNPTLKAGETHPDSAKWIAKWTRFGKTGAVIPENRQKDSRKRSLRVLYAPIYEPGKYLSIQTSSKRGLRESLQKVAIVSECDYANMQRGYIHDLADALQPDVFLTQLHDHTGNIGFDDIVELRKAYPQAKFVNWNGDYHSEHLFAPDYIKLMKQFDHCGFVVDLSDSRLYDNVSWFYWQLGYEPFTVDVKSKLNYDVVFLANGYSMLRHRLASELRNMTGIEFGLYGSWPNGLRPDGDTLYNFDAGATIYSHSKMAIGDSQWSDAKGYVSNRLFQAMAAGTLLLQQRFAGMEDLLGLVDGEHLVVWDTHKDLKEKIAYYMQHEDERKTIASNGCKFIKENHSFDNRVEELLYAIGF